MNEVEQITGQLQSVNAELQVDIRSCRLRREGREILRDVKFAIRPGDKVGIIGESGAGKSTLFHAMLGYLSRSDWDVTGSVVYDSKDLLTYSPKEWEAIRGRNFRVLLQEPAISINPAFRIQYQLEQSYKLACPEQKKSQRMKNIVELMYSLNLTPALELLKRFPGELSGGQLQRVSIAMAIGPPCQYLFADEPTNSLDSVISMELIDLLKRLHSDGYARTLVFITHDMSIARALECNRILMLHDGNLVEDQQLRDFIHEPQSKDAKIMIKTNERLNRFSERVNMRELPTVGSEVVGDVQNLSYSYRRRGIVSKRGPDVVHNVSFQLQRGEFLGLIGNSGEGKTTIALSLALLMDEFQGEISILNTGVKELRTYKIHRQFRRQVQVVPQNASTSFDPKQTILENCIECMRGRGLRVDDGLVTYKRLMTYFRISDRCIYKYPHQLSSGEKQRLAIIRALIGNTQVLIADEPFMHLDAGNKERLLRLLLLLKRRKGNPLTCVLIMHDLHLTRNLCNSILIIHEGKILEENSPDAILKSPKYEQTKKLVDATMFLRNSH